MNVSAVFLITSLFGLVMGHLADKFNRKWLLFICAMIWNLATTSAYFT